MMQHRFEKDVTIYLIRHGQSVANVSDMIGGAASPLTDVGRSQARALSGYLHDRPIEGPKRVFCSALLRARQTAEILTKGLGIRRDDLIEDVRLNEISRGDWDGKRRSELYTPEESRDFELFEMDYRAPNGETMHDVAARMRSWVYDLNILVAGEGVTTFVAVTHGIATVVLLQRIFHWTPAYVWLTHVDNTGVTKIRATRKGWHLEYLNRVPHLADSGL